MRIFLIVAGFVIIAASCNRSNFIGEELLPDEDFLNSERADTFKLITYTALDDSIVTSQNEFFSLGSINSDKYGKSSAGIYAQVLLPTNNLYFGVSPVVDSIVVSLDYAGSYGDSTSLQSVKIYRMIDQMRGGKLYYSDTKFHVMPIPIGGKSNFKANLKDSILLGDGNYYVPHLRIKLAESFAQNIINLDSSFLENDTAFLDYLSGLYIQADTLDAGFSNQVLYFNLASTLSGVNIYYHNAEADSLHVIFPFTGVKMNSYTHNYPEFSPSYFAINFPDTTNGDKNTYVQGFGGLRTILKIPTLENLKDVSINKAELIITATSHDGNIFAAPPKLQLLQIDTTGHNFFYLAFYRDEVYSAIIDDNLGLTDIGGIITKGVDDAGRVVYQYKYIITRHVQEILQGTIPNNGFSLVCIPGNRIPNAVTLGGTSNDRYSYQPYFSVTYTTINK